MAAGLIVLTVLGFISRFHMLGSIPFGLQQDEASIGYDAWCLVEYGIDRNGYTWPVYPISWGSGGGSPLLDYLVVISTAIFGRSHWSLRFFPAFLGALTIPLWGLCAAEAAYPRRAVRKDSESGGHTLWMYLIFIPFLTLVNPWHFMLSRWTLDSNILPFFELLSIGLFVRASMSSESKPADPGSGNLSSPADGSSRRRMLLYPASAVCFALTVYSYGSATVVVPLSLIVMAFFTIKAGRMNIRELISSIVIFTLMLVPLIAFFAINALGLDPVQTPLFSIPVLTASRSVFHGVSELVSTLPDNLRYLLHLFTTGAEDGELSCNFIPGYGQMYSFTFPLTFLGLFAAVARVIRCRRNDRPEFPAADICFLTITAVSVLFLLFIDCDINRVTPLLIPLLYFQGRGLSILSGCLLSIASQSGVSRKQRGGKPEKQHHVLRSLPYFCGLAIALVFCVLILRDSRHFFSDYFGETWAVQNKDVFMPGYCEAVQEAYSQAKGSTTAEKTVVSTYARLSAPFILALYETELPPADFLDSVVWKDEHAEFRVAVSFKGFSFGLEHARDSSNADHKVSKKKSGDIQSLSVGMLDDTVFILHMDELRELPEFEPYVTGVFDDYAVIASR